MKKIFTQSIALACLIGVALIANQVAAGNPAVVNPGGFSANNTPFPVTVGTYDQVKGAGAPPANGGGLAVEAFIAWQNASFDKDVGIQGILMGKPLIAGNTSNSNLLFGNAATTNVVTVNTSGWTYAQSGGLYTQVEKSKTAGTYTPLCANNAGEIIKCPGATVITGSTSGASVRLVNNLATPTAPYTNLLTAISPQSWTSFMTTDLPIDPQTSFASVHDTYAGGPFTVTANVGVASKVTITNDTTGASVCSGLPGLGTKSYPFTATDMSIVGASDDITILLTAGSC
jgi:hypothetical protein